MEEHLLGAGVGGGGQGGGGLERGQVRQLGAKLKEALIVRFM